MSYQPIENYGLIGNMRTSALVGINGSIDWFCFPHFDSPSIFAGILDEHKGGRFKIASNAQGVKHKQYYWPDTNVLVTRFLSTQGVGQVVDFMPVGLKETDLGYHGIIRRVQAIRGTVTFRLDCIPAFNYARDPHKTSITSDGACFDATGVSLRLGSTIPLQEENQGVAADFELHEGQELCFSLQEVERGSDSCVAITQEKGEELFRQTVEFWRR